MTLKIIIILKIKLLSRNYFNNEIFECKRQQKFGKKGKYKSTLKERNWYSIRTEK